MTLAQTGTQVRVIYTNSADEQELASEPATLTVTAEPDPPLPTPEPPLPSPEPTLPTPNPPVGTPDPPVTTPDPAPQPGGLVNTGSSGTSGAPNGLWAAVALLGLGAAALLRNDRRRRLR